MKKVEMIISYTTDGTDFQYHDNHGILVRCKDCKHCNETTLRASGESMKFYTCEFLSETTVDALDYCSRGEKKDV